MQVTGCQAVDREFEMGPPALPPTPTLPSGSWVLQLRSGTLLDTFGHPGPLQPPVSSLGFLRPHPGGAILKPIHCFGQPPFSRSPKRMPCAARARATCKQGCWITLDIRIRGKERPLPVGGVAQSLFCSLFR
jgi:hypothetical protein